MIDELCWWRSSSSGEKGYHTSFVEDLYVEDKDWEGGGFEENEKPVMCALMGRELPAALTDETGCDKGGGRRSDSETRLRCLDEVLKEGGKEH